MKKLRKIFNRFVKRYYSWMLTVCAEQIEFSRVEHGEESDETTRWVELYEKYTNKYEKLTGETF